MTTEIEYTNLKNELENKRVIVFGGFSGLGYEDEDALKMRIKDRIELDINKYGKENVAVVAGATSDGIGVCYEIAKSLGVSTYGIVSEAGKKYGSDKYCDKTVFIEDPNNTWQVLDSNGSSYMVDIAKNNGTLVYFGGGDVAVSEIKEAVSKNIDFEVSTVFEPNPAQVLKKKEKNPNLDPTPLRTYLENNPIMIAYALDSDGNHHPVYKTLKDEVSSNVEKISATIDLSKLESLKQKWSEIIPTKIDTPSKSDRVSRIDDLLKKMRDGDTLSNNLDSTPKP